MDDLKQLIGMLSNDFSKERDWFELFMYLSFLRKMYDELEEKIDKE